MLLRSAPPIRESEVTDHRLYLDRRRFLALGAAAALFRPGRAEAVPLGNYRKGAVTIDEKLTSMEAATSYNNFYEFGTEKSDSSRLAPGRLKTKPWTVTIDGACSKPGRMDVDDLIRPHQLEERIYRLRCVEAWSMVLPWIGVPLATVLKRFEPTSNAKYVVFTTLMDPEQMPEERVPFLDWPYTEGLRMDEAMHPLTLLAVGLYGQELLPQNGAPLRLVVPWKYGYKSIKSIVRITFAETQPTTTWMKAGPYDYGFYSNVNPDSSLRRWSQASERRIGEFFRRKTLPFNGYGEQVASLYQGQEVF